MRCFDVGLVCFPEFSHTNSRLVIHDIHIVVPPMYLQCIILTNSVGCQMTGVAPNPSRLVCPSRTQHLILAILHLAWEEMRGYSPMMIHEKNVRIRVEERGSA